jgi:hypothetical protein
MMDEEVKVKLRSFRYTTVDDDLIKRCSKKLKMGRSAFFRYAVRTTAERVLHGESVLMAQKSVDGDRG